MIDIQQDRVKLPARLIRIEAFRRLGPLEEVGLDHSAARITGEFLA